MRIFDRITSEAASALRGFTGDKIGRLGPRPVEPLLLFEFESCPFCRKVREALSILDLDAIVHPCPKGGERFRDEVLRRGGQLRFPYLVDPNPAAGEKAMYESSAIVDYLFATYGRGKPPVALRAQRIALVTSAAASAVRTRGRSSRPSREPAQPLELWAYEASAESRPVREVLCELELRYVLHTAAHGSTKRGELRRKWGEAAIPFLHDPNAGVSTYGASQVVEHLERTYFAP
jgi:glutathione S-transferase